jgi:putative Mg2+ transporter-C (MgtC) family protein
VPRPPENRETWWSKTVPTNLGWDEVAIRLALTVIAGGLVGLNRGEHGRPAGLRTTILVCLAASVAMIQANLLLDTKGRSPDSFIMMDLMRLPLGILSGIGFIGAGAILRRGDRVLGITTAATLWFVTVMGLCFGGGQLALGAVMLALAIIVLWGLKWVENHIDRDQHATLLLVATADGPTEEEIRGTLLAAGFRVLSYAATYAAASQFRFRCELRWKGRNPAAQTPPVVHQLQARPGVVRLQWKTA